MNDQDNRRRALVCGVSGQDGAYLARLLLSKGYEVYGTSRDAQTSAFSGLRTLGIFSKVKTLSMSPADYCSVLQAIRRTQPQEIYNLTGQSSVGLSFDQPFETLESIAFGTLNLLEAIRLTDPSIRFYNAGSSECFGDTGGAAADEATPFHPRSPYAVAKAAATYQVSVFREAYGLFACTGILFNHESPLRPGRFVTQKVVSAAYRIAQGSHEKLHLGNIDILRDWGWAPEYVEAMWRMLHHDRPEDFVIATGATQSLKEFVAVVFEQAGLDWRTHVISDPQLCRPSDPRESRGNPGKARKILGWTATCFGSQVPTKLYLEHQGSRNNNLQET